MEWARGHLKLVGDGESAAFIRFQRNLLRKHDIARHEIALRHEAPALPRSAVTIELDDVRTDAVLNPITGAAITPNNLEIIIGLQLP